MWAWMCVCFSFWLSFLVSFLWPPRPLMILSEHPGPDVVFYQEDGALGSPKGSCAEEEGSLVEGGLRVRHKSQTHNSYEPENRTLHTCNW